MKKMKNCATLTGTCNNKTCWVKLRPGVTWFQWSCSCLLQGWICLMSCLASIFNFCVSHPSYCNKAEDAPGFTIQYFVCELILRISWLPHVAYQFIALYWTHFCIKAIRECLKYGSFHIKLNSNLGLPGNKSHHPILRGLISPFA